jgi:ProP effector
MTDTLPAEPINTPASAPATAAAPVAAKKRRAARPQGPDSFPVLEKLAALYPQLFGAVFLPLKRGIFQDLMTAHPDVLEREALKAALALHTRSTRYLTTVAAGEKRHDLQGRPVEDMAPEHVYHSLLEVFRRRHQRAGEDVRPALRKRILQAFEASGMSRDAYVALVRGRDEAANTLLDEALAEAGERAARDEALLRAFESSSQSVESFADMYGMEARLAGDALERARRVRPPAPTQLLSPTAVETDAS